MMVTGKTGHCGGVNALVRFDTLGVDGSCFMLLEAQSVRSSRVAFLQPHNDRFTIRDSSLS